MNEETYKLDITLKSKVLNINPINFDTEFIKKVVGKDKDTKEVKYPSNILIYGDNGIGKTTFSECFRIQDINNNLYDVQNINLGSFKDYHFYVYNINIHGFLLC